MSALSALNPQLANINSNNLVNPVINVNSNVKPAYKVPQFKTEAQTQALCMQQHKKGYEFQERAEKIESVSIEQGKFAQGKVHSKVAELKTQKPIDEATARANTENRVTEANAALATNREDQQRLSAFLLQLGTKEELYARKSAEVKRRLGEEWDKAHPGSTRAPNHNFANGIEQYRLEWGTYFEYDLIFDKIREFDKANPDFLWYPDEAQINIGGKIQPFNYVLANKMLNTLKAEEADLIERKNDNFPVRNAEELFQSRAVAFYQSEVVGNADFQERAIIMSRGMAESPQVYNCEWWNLIITVHPNTGTGDPVAISCYNIEFNKYCPVTNYRGDANDMYFDLVDLDGTVRLQKVDGKYGMSILIGSNKIFISEAGVGEAQFKRLKDSFLLDPKKFVDDWNDEHPNDKFVLEGSEVRSVPKSEALAKGSRNRFDKQPIPKTTAENGSENTTTTMEEGRRETTTQLVNPANTNTSNTVNSEFYTERSWGIGMNILAIAGIIGTAVGIGRTLHYKKKAEEEVKQTAAVKREWIIEKIESYYSQLLLDAIKTKLLQLSESAPKNNKHSKENNTTIEMKNLLNKEYTEEDLLFIVKHMSSTKVKELYGLLQNYDKKADEQSEGYRTQERQIQNTNLGFSAQVNDMQAPQQGVIDKQLGDIMSQVATIMVKAACENIKSQTYNREAGRH